MALDWLRRRSVVAASTVAFTVCFMVWMMVAVTGISIEQALELDETPFGALIALSVLTGSLFPFPVGLWTDKYDGRVPTHDVHGRVVRLQGVRSNLD